MSRTENVSNDFQTKSERKSLQNQSDYYGSQINGGMRNSNVFGSVLSYEKKYDTSDKRKVVVGRNANSVFNKLRNYTDLTLKNRDEVRREDEKVKEKFGKVNLLQDTNDFLVYRKMEWALDRKPRVFDSKTI